MFRYKGIDDALIAELIEHALHGQSIALLGPRYSGKRHVLDKIFAAVERAGRSPLVRLRLLRERPIFAQQELFNLLREALSQAGIAVADAQADPFDVLADYARKHERRVFLFAANLDATAIELARLLLQRFRQLVEEKLLVVVMTGESDFHELVAGENSEFKTSENYFLQGCAPSELDEFLAPYCRTLHIELQPREAVLNRLWELTGGSMYLLRPLIVQVIEQMVKEKKRVGDRPITLDDFARIPGAKELPGNYWTQLCRHATRLISWAPECWPQLEQLNQHGRVPINSGAPTILEWAGVARRTEDRQSLVFASEMMRNYVQQHYDKLRIGDLYACVGKWPKAFAHYEQLPLEQRRRPISASDRTQLEKVVNAFGAALHAEAAKGLKELKSLFALGCRYLFGLEEVTFWCHSHETPRPLPLPGEAQAIPTDLVQTAATILLPPAPDSEWLAIPRQWREFVIARRLPSSLSNSFNSVVVSELDSRVPISRLRREWIEHLLDQFAEAYQHAMTVMRQKRRLERLSAQTELINSVLVKLGSDVRDVNDVLKRAAAGLASLGQYRRVLFCLVDPKRQRIQGVLNYCPSAPEIDLDNQTDYALTDWEQDIQPWVIATRQPFRTANAADPERAQFTNKKLVALAKIGAMAIVPILNHLEEAIGTIHVEREDGFEPPVEEAEDLLNFGRSLAMAIEQARRVNLLQTTLDKIPTPIAIVSPLERFRYANRAAAERYFVDSGWQGDEKFGSELNDASPVAKPVRAAASTRTVQSFPIDARTGYVISDVIQDWRGETAGTFFYVKEALNLERVVGALKRIAAKEGHDWDQMEQMLEETKGFGYTQGRLYLFDRKTESLVSHRCYGMAEQEEFDRGAYRLPKEHVSSWACFAQQGPVIFCYEPDGVEGTIQRTAQGLQYRIITNPHYRVELHKQRGDFWIDFPLINGAEKLGKLTLTCTEFLSLEQFDLLSMLLHLDNLMMERNLSYIREIDRLALQRREEAADYMVHKVAHSLGSHLAPFPSYLRFYRRREKKLPELHECNDLFAQALAQAMAIIKRAKEYLAPVHPKWERVELSDFFSRALKTNLPENKGAVTGLRGPLEVALDPHLLKVALWEMIDNSRVAHAARPGADPLRVDLTLNDTGPDEVQVIYLDNGPGIADEARKRVFEDFFTYRPEGAEIGTGLGMSLVKRIIEAHGGTAKVGRPGPGAELIFTLPKRVPLSNGHAGQPGGQA